MPAMVRPPPAVNSHTTSAALSIDLPFPCAAVRTLTYCAPRTTSPSGRLATTTLPTGPRHRRRVPDAPAWWVLGVPAAGVVVVLAAESLLWPLGRDQGIYAWVADAIRDGGLPYED